MCEPVSKRNPAKMLTNGGDGANGASARGDASANDGATDDASRDAHGDANANAPRWSAASHSLAQLQQRRD
jgi:hypothetical protein